VSRTVNFLTFFIIWARLQGWTVPLLHVRICTWLETCDAPERVLMVFRGAAKSTIYAVYKAWKLYRNPQRRSLVWSADGPTAEMLTADVINVLRNHPLTAHLLGGRKPGKKRFWVNGTRDARNASMRAVGVDSNATGSRADDVDFDDIEVPGNIETPEARAKLRHRFTFTPGADGLYVMLGIHQGARMLVEGRDFRIERDEVVFDRPPGAVLDIAAGCAWPERFDRKEIELRRRKTRTLNAWDSQYGLEAKPLTEVRLDPARIVPYAVEPVMRYANGSSSLWLGSQQIVGAACRWDPSSGKLKSDASALAVVFQDENGRRYLHRVTTLFRSLHRVTSARGEIAEFSEDGKTITGGQVMAVCDLVEALNLPRVSVETNGIGGFAPAVLRAALKQRRLLPCGVVEIDSTTNKNKRILETFEPLLLSRGMLWAHVSVLQDPVTKKHSTFWTEMRDWNPGIASQPDDHLDASSGAIAEQPERIKAKGGIPSTGQRNDWRPTGGSFEVEFER
jgi:hypothetical protein